MILPANQHEIVTRLAAGERLLGPVTVLRGPYRSAQTRAFGWRDGRSVHAASVAGLERRRIVEIRPAADADLEVVLKETKS